MYTVLATKKEYLHTVHKTVRHPPLGLDAGSVAVSGLAASAVAVMLLLHAGVGAGRQAGFLAMG